MGLSFTASTEAFAIPAPQEHSGLAPCASLNRGSPRELGPWKGGGNQNPDKHN